MNTAILQPTDVAGPALPWATCALESIPVSRLGYHTTTALIAGWLGQDGSRRIATANLDFLRLAHGDDELRETLRTADLVTADGWPLVMLSRMTRTPIRERVAGSDLVPDLLRVAECDRRSVYFLGSTPEVMDAALRVIRERHPELVVAGHDSPFVDWDDPRAAGAVADSVRAAQPDLLFVALGCPRQDLFLARYLERTGARVGIGIGGTLDFLAGHRRRASGAAQALGLEWLVRLAQEPDRLAARYGKDLLHLVQAFGRQLRAS